MARITMLPLEREVEDGEIDGDTINRDVFRILAHRPVAAEALKACVDAVYSSGTLPERLRELVRLRIAFHNQCRSCMSIRFNAALEEGVTDELVCSLEKPAEAPDLTAAERSALQYADLFATNHLAIDDEVYDDLRNYFDEGEIVELGLHCALCVGTGRLAASWNVVEHLPESYKAEGTVAPWSGQQLIAGSRLSKLGEGN